MPEEFSFEDALIVLRRRILYFVIPAMLVAIAGVSIVMMLPAQYTASGTILVESQQIPTDLVRSTINAYAQERIQTIRQRVMTRARLLEVADKYDIFDDDQDLSDSARVNLMRSRVDVSLITIEGGRRVQQDGTIAFTVSYTDPSPDKAFQIANEFMTLFLREDVRTRTAGASNTTEFFDREAAKLRVAVSKIEKQLADYKAENADALPEHLDMHLDMLERATQNFNSARRSIAALEEEKRFLESQLVSGGGANNTLAQELSRLEAELARLRANYHDTFPAVQAKMDEIAAVKQQMAPSARFQELRRSLKAAEADLTDAERATPVSPEAVAAAEARVEAARDALSEQISEDTRRGALDTTGVQLEGRLALLDSRIRTTKRQAAAFEQDIAEYQRRIEMTPAVERDLTALTRDYENLFSEYQELLAKRQDAQLAENLEQDQRAEKFSILEAAVPPEKPSSPDRPKFIVVALMAALGAGGGVAMLAEGLFAKVRGREHLARILQDHPIAVVPYMPGATQPKPATVLLRKFKGSRRSPSPA